MVEPNCVAVEKIFVVPVVYSLALVISDKGFVDPFVLNVKDVTLSGERLPFVLTSTLMISWSSSPGATDAFFFCVVVLEM